MLYIHFGEIMEIYPRNRNRMNRIEYHSVNIDMLNDHSSFKFKENSQWKITKLNFF